MKSHSHNKQTIRILGTRGIPAAHGGFETFAEHLSLYLSKRGWKVIVYCQKQGKGLISEDTWEGVQRIQIPISRTGAIGTIIFDWLAILHACRHSDPCLTLGYNTAVFCSLLRLKRIPNIINMDGIEWSRAKWRAHERLWLWVNERIGCFIGNHLVADHPKIKAHLSQHTDGSKISVIAYGSDHVCSASTDYISSINLEPNRYLTIIARPEPENSILEVVRGFSSKIRGLKLVVLGNYDRSIRYHAEVLDAAGSEVLFPGAIYDKDIVQALRFHSLAYVHGHQVGGTNPSLVEALGCGSAVVAHDNEFNRWVAGESALYFSNETEFCRQLDALTDSRFNLKSLRNAAVKRHAEAFSWNFILSEYESLLIRHSN